MNISFLLNEDLFIQYKSTIFFFLTVYFQLHFSSASSRETIVSIDDKDKTQYHEVNFDTSKLNYAINHNLFNILFKLCACHHIFFFFCNCDWIINAKIIDCILLCFKNILHFFTWQSPHKELWWMFWLHKFFLRCLTLSLLEKKVMLDSQSNLSSFFL